MPDILRTPLHDDSDVLRDEIVLAYSTIPLDGHKRMPKQKLKNSEVNLGYSTPWKDSPEGHANGHDKMALMVSIANSSALLLLKCCCSPSCDHRLMSHPAPLAEVERKGPRAMHKAMFCGPLQLTTQEIITKCSSRISSSCYITDPETL